MFGVNHGTSRPLVRAMILVAGFLTVPALALPAAAQTSPNAPSNAPVQQAGNWYVWADGSYQSLKLPHYDIGFVRSGSAGFVLDRGPVDGFNPRPTGGAPRGAIGYIISDAPLWPLLGSHTRVDFGGSYVSADDNQSTGTNPVPNSFVFLNINGIVFDGPLGCFGPRCITHATLKTQVRAWQADVRVLTDYALGPFTFTPSVAGFYGQTRDKQDGTQTIGFPALVIAAYAVNSTLRWNDLGAKLGGDLSVMPNARTTLTVGGSVGFAVRDVSFDANDSITPMNGYTPPATSVPTSSVSQSDTVTALLLNAEARLDYRLTPAIAIKSFVGVNYDNRVPGVAGPSYGGGGAPLAVQQPGPAHIFYAGETSYYAGGGFVVSFGP
jgi:hypothetical protein